MHSGRKTGGFALAGARIVLGRRASETLRLAAGELARYLYLLTGRGSEVVESLPASGAAAVLDKRAAAKLGVKATRAATGEQGYRLKAVSRGRLRALVIAAAAPVGALYGVYGLLEELGMGFYAGGDTFPQRPTRAEVSADLDRLDRPAMAARGNMLHYNFLCGCTDWGLGDWKFYFDQLARMRANMLLMHWYDNEPAAAYEVDGEVLAGGRTPNSLSRPWGAMQALRTSEFAFETGRLFDEEIFSSPAGEDLPDRVTEIRRTEAMFAEATRYAKVRGVRVAAGFEAPKGGDPTCRRTVARFRARVGQFLGRNPDLTYFALWQHEGGGCAGSRPPRAGTAAAKLLAGRRGTFEHLGAEQRIWEAVRFGRFAEIAAGLLAKEFPRLRLVVVGWGGDRWMRFADLCLGYDKLLPADVIFTCHDNIDASMGPNVSTPWGRLPPDRERWAMPWVEGDIDGCLVRQPNVESLGRLAPDALAKGCQGLLTLQWRTRDVEEETAFAARFAWDTALTPEAFYRDLARRAFGADHEHDLGRCLATLQRLGARWTGVRGTVECGGMVWTGWRPHFPFELDGAAAAYLAPLARKASRVLAEVPPAGAGDEGAFHLRKESKGKVRTDRSRPGAREMANVARRLRSLAGQTDPQVLRSALAEIEQQVYALRYDLVTAGMTGAGFQAIDGFLLAIHHVVRNAGAAEHFAVLRQIRRRLAKLRGQYLRRKRIARLERLDHLDATIEFALSLDSVAMMLADGEAFDRAVAAAREARAGASAAEIAAAAYERLVEAGMRQALHAYGRKLSNRCDWGVLTTLNVKFMPAYWQAIETLEAMIPAPPPRQIRARGRSDEIWLSWDPSAKAAGYHVYRRADGGKWRRANKAALDRGCTMFVDRPRPGAYHYALTAIDDAGAEGPLSHRAEATCGPDAAPPRLVAAKPHSHLPAGRDFEVRVVVLSDRDVAGVEIVYRGKPAGAWRRAPMRLRFRDSYAGAIPGRDIRPGVLVWYVRAADREGRTAVWPASAEAALPWTATVT